MKKEYRVPDLEQLETEGLTALVSLNLTDGDEVEISGGDLFGVDNIKE